jgi:hypothetical protein
VDLQNNMLSPLNALSNKTDTDKGAALIGYKGEKLTKHLDVIDEHFAVRRFEDGRNPAGAVDDAPNLIAGHSKNYIVSDVHSSTISGGGMVNKENVIGGVAANVGTGNSNVPNDPILDTQSQFCLIGGGYDNVCNGLANVITVGQHCVIDLPADHGSIHGGSRNQILDGSYNTIGGGSRNECYSDGYAVVAGGGDNRVGASNSYSVISGGSGNENYAPFSVISGGQYNTVQNDSPTSVVAGGSGNKTEQPNSAVSGGNGNLVKATGQGCAIGGGLSNTAEGECAVVIGGRDNEATKNYSQASGYQAKVSRVGQEAFANGKIFNRGDAQTSRIILKGNTAGLETVQLADLANRVDFPSQANIAMGYKIRLVAHGLGVDNEGGVVVLEGLASRGASGSWLITPFTDKNVATSGLTGITAQVIDSVGSLRVSATGVTGASVQWVAHVEYTENIG